MTRFNRFRYGVHTAPIVTVVYPGAGIEEMIQELMRGPAKAHIGQIADSVPHRPPCARGFSVYLTSILCSSVTLDILAYVSSKTVTSPQYVPVTH